LLLALLLTPGICTTEGKKNKNKIIIIIITDDNGLRQELTSPEQIMYS